MPKLIALLGTALIFLFVYFSVSAWAVSVLGLFPELANITGFLAGVVTAGGLYQTVLKRLPLPF